MKFIQEDFQRLPSDVIHTDSLEHPNGLQNLSDRMASTQSLARKLGT